MIVDFKSISHDFYGKIEQPVLMLKTPDGRAITTISNYYGLDTIFRFNDVSEVTFSVPAFYEGIPNNGYEEIHGLRLVEVEPFGDFILVNPEISNEGGKKEIKVCKAYSLEYAFNKKKIDIAAGTYNFYNPIDNTDTIMQIIVDLMPDWSIGEIDRKLIGRWRTFDNIDDNLYSFMMNTLQESFNCLFLFDTFNKKINVMEANRSTYKLPIYLSYNNLIKNVKITELSDEIVTALSGYGSGDDVDIRTVNPNGTNTIYNLDYFISNGDLPDALAAKWVTYDDSLEVYRQIFSNLSVLETQKINERELANAKRIVLETEYDNLNTTYLTAQTNKDVNADYDYEIAVLRSSLLAKEVELNIQIKHIEMLDTDIAEIEKKITEITNVCKIESYFTKEEIKILSQYFIHDSIVDDTFVIPEYSSAILESTSNVITEDNFGRIKIVGAETYASNIAEVFTTDENGVYQAYTIDPENGESIYNTNNADLFHEIDLNPEIAQTVADQLNDNEKRKMYEFRGGIFDFAYVVYDEIEGIKTPKNVNLKGDIVNVDFVYNIDNMLNWENDSSPDITKLGHYTLSATLRNAEYDGVSYPNMNFLIQGMIRNNIPQIDDHFISFEISNAVFYITASNTVYQKQTIIQELYDYINDSLKKLSTPSYEFSVESGNFVFAKEFEPFKNQLELGCTINLALDDNEDNIIQPILIEIGLNYDNESSFTITFSNKYRSSGSEFQLADIITNMSHKTQSVARNKGNYQAYKDSKAGSQVSNLTTSAIDVVKNKVINSSNQAIEWNSSGMFFRKKLSDGSFDGRQIGIINEDIAFTKDGWKTVDIAIGAYNDPDNEIEGYGIIAPNIIGTLIAGENLIIENENKQFKFDKTGAWLYNSSLAFVQDSMPEKNYPGGKLLIDPNYGIAAGNDKLFTLNGTEITPSFWDKENDEIIWDENELVETADGSMYYVPLNTQFYFDIHTGNAYFSGTINGKNIIAETINGLAIMPGTISGDALVDGSIDLGKLSGDTIPTSFIKGLTNKNFKDGKIVADEIDAKNIKNAYESNGTLWSGKSLMGKDANGDILEIDFINSIKNQFSGAIFAFSYEYGEDSDCYWTYTFVPKYHILHHEGEGVSFEMTTPSGSDAGHKYLYISNNKMIGHDNNDVIVQGENEIYKNDRWYLRYVIGV